MRDTIQFYKEALSAAKSARNAIEKARADFETYSQTERKWLENGSLTQKGYDEKIAELAAARDEKIAEAQQTVLDVAKEFDEEMKLVARLDGSKIDDATLSILNSGLKLSREDWEQLAEQHKDNWIMSRILQQRYDADPIYTDSANGLIDGVTKEKVNMQFGVNPMRRAEVFSSFVNLIAHGSESGTVLTGYKDQDSYWNYLAQKSVKDIKPVGDDDFSNLESTFPVEYPANDMPKVW